MHPTDPEVDRIRQVFGQDKAEDAQARWSLDNPGNRAEWTERWRVTRLLLEEHGRFPTAATMVLDVGCGLGAGLEPFLDWGVPADRLYGVDLLPDRIDAARSRFPGVHFSCQNAETLPFPDQTFDLILICVVFSSILDPDMAINVANQVRRLLRPAGAIVWYDFRYNNPWNPHVRGIDKGEIDRLFPDLQSHLRAVTLLPPLARRLGKSTSLLYPLLSRAAPLRTHYAGLLAQSG